MLFIKKNTLVISDAANYTTDEARELLCDFFKLHPDMKKITRRTEKNFLNEWSVCAFCYLLGFMKEKAKDADMGFTVEPEVEFLFSILGPLSRLFLKLYHK